MSNGKQRGIGGARCVRFSVSVSNDFDSKLMRLVTSCAFSKAEMANVLLEISLSSPELIDKLQDQSIPRPVT